MWSSTIIDDTASDTVCLRYGFFRDHIGRTADPLDYPGGDIRIASSAYMEIMPRPQRYGWKTVLYGPK